MTAFSIADIQPNPFRHIDRYPIRRDKVAALRESLRTTGFWDNVVARVGPDSKPQIAYGHHRLVALREEYQPSHKVNLIVRDLPDDQMLKIMARENLEEWGTSAAVEHETVRAVVEAYAEGRIDLPRPGAKTTTGIRYAPSFIADGPDPGPDQPYAASVVADFLGWTEPSGAPQKKVLYALAALQFIEEGVLTETDFAGLTTKQAEAVVEQARRAKAANEAKARAEREQAERARREAAEAEKRREAAERERARHAEQAKKAREEEQRRKAEREAVEAERRAAIAARQREEAERRETAATKTGRHVGEQLRGGRGYKDAADIAEEVRDKRDQGPPPHIDDYARRLAAKLNRILDPDLDDRAKELEPLIKFQSAMTARSLQDLLTVLSRIAQRAERYQARLSTAEDAGNFIEGEVVEDAPPAITQRARKQTPR